MVCVWLSSAPARADELARCPVRAEQATPPSGYQTAVADAVSDHDAGRFLDARAQFLRAHALYPSARTLRGLGMVEFELRRYVESVRYLEAALACDVRPLGEAMRGDAERLLGRARAYVGELALEVEPAPSRVALDGEPLDPAVTRFLLGVGSHELTIEAPEHEPARRSFDIVGGETRSLRVALAPLALATSPRVGEPGAPSHDEPPASEPSPRRRRVLLWVSLGAVALAGIATGAVFALRSSEGGDPEPARTGHEITGEVLSTLLRTP